LNGVHVPELHGSVTSAQMETSPLTQPVAQCDPVKPEPRSKPHVESSATVPAAQQTGPAELAAQSTGPLHPHEMEPATGQVVPIAWHVEPLGVVLGVSQHSCPAVHLTEPVGVKGQ
jgi:hypothetical protein